METNVKVGRRKRYAEVRPLTTIPLYGALDPPVDFAAQRPEVDWLSQQRLKAAVRVNPNAGNLRNNPMMIKSV